MNIMNQSFQQLTQVQGGMAEGINLKTQQYGGEPSITHSRAISKCSHTTNPEQMLSYFQSYSPGNQSFIPALQKLHQSEFLKMKRYKQSVYYGQFRNGKRAGVGIMLYNNGKVYQGEWTDDMKEGIGFQKFPNSCTYKGGYVAGKPEGVGRYSWNNGQQFYEGEWQNGLKHGSGMWRGTKGDSYIGEWRQGKADGYGVHTWVTGDRYEGQFKACLKHGQGIQKFANGDIYKGNYNQGKPSGFGEYYWANGSYFKGSFQKGLRNGNGIWKRAQGNSDKYQGEYIEDCKSGYGIFTWASGNVYKGTYQSDQRHGYGQMYWSDGSYYKGQWDKGIQHGAGQIYVPEQGWKKGTFSNNILVAIQDEQEPHYAINKNTGYKTGQPHHQNNGENRGIQNHVRIRRSIQSKEYKSITPNSMNTSSTNGPSKTIGQSNRNSNPSRFTVRPTNNRDPNTNVNNNKVKINKALNERIVIDLSRNYNNPLLPNKFNAKRNRNSLSIEDPQKIKSKNRQKILHSSFYLHKLHNMRNNLDADRSQAYSVNPRPEKHLPKRDTRTGSQFRKKGDIVDEVRSFTKGKLNTFTPNHPL